LGHHQPRSTKTTQVQKSGAVIDRLFDTGVLIKEPVRFLGRNIGLALAILPLLESAMPAPGVV